MRFYGYPLFFTSLNHFHESAESWIHLNLEQCYRETLFILSDFFWYFVNNHGTFELVSLYFNSFKLVEVISIIEYYVDIVLLFCKGYEDDNILLFDNR